MEDPEIRSECESMETWDCNEGLSVLLTSIFSIDEKHEFNTGCLTVSVCSCDHLYSELDHKDHLEITKTTWSCPNCGYYHTFYLY